jgi:hypothetical protein
MFTRVHVAEHTESSERGAVLPLRRALLRPRIRLIVSDASSWCYAAIIRYLETSSLAAITVPPAFDKIERKVGSVRS